MSSNFSVNRSAINYIHARDYFPKGEIEEFRPWLENVKWVDTKFGKEIENINLIFENIDIILGKMSGDLLEIDRKNSGTLRKTLHEVIHFEDFEDTNDWRFVVAVDDNAGAAVAVIAAVVNEVKAPQVTPVAVTAYDLA